MNGIQSLTRKARKPRAPKYAAGGITKLVPRYDSGGTPASTVVSNVPAFAEQPYRDLVQSASDYVHTPTPTYTGERLATFTPLQEQGFQGVANLAPSGQSTAAGTLAQTAGDKALGATYDPSQFTSTLPGGPQQTSTQSFTAPGTADKYMNPYMQSVVDIGKREATRNDDIARTQRNAAAVGAGAFGGSRQAIVEAEANKNLQQHLGDIQQQGSDAAFKAAQQQFDTEQQQGLQSQIANQGAGLTYNQQDLNRQQLAEGSRQFGANLGMQGAQTAATAASTLGGIGSDIFKQNQGAAAAQLGAGGVEQGQVQTGLDLNYQDYLQQLNDPVKKMGLMSDILHGTQGISQVTSATPASPSTAQTLAGLGTLIYGMSKAKGGSIERSSAIDRGLARIAPDSAGDFKDGGIIGYAGGGGTGVDWSQFETRPPSKEFGPVRPRPGLPPGVAAEPAVAGGAAAEAEVAAAARQGLLRKAAPVGARLAIPLSLAERGYTIADTGSDEYAKRFGVDYNDPKADHSLLGDLNLRAKGAMDDLTFGIPRRLFGHSDPTFSKNPTPPPGEPEVPSATDLYALTGKGAGAGGIGVPQVHASPAPGLKELLADREAAGAGTGAYDTLEKQQIANAKEIGGLSKTDAEKAAQDTRDAIAQEGIYGAKREETLKGRLGDIETQRGQSEKNAYITAGLAMLSAPPGAKGIGGLLATIAPAAQKGITQYNVDKDKLNKDKMAAEDSTDALLQARADRARANAKEVAAADREVRKAEIQQYRDVSNVMGNFGLAKIKSNEEVAKSYEEMRAKQRQEELQASVSNAGNATHLGVAQIGLQGHLASLGALGLGGINGIGGKPMTEAQYANTVRQYAVPLLKQLDANGQPYTEQSALAEAKRQVDALRRGHNPGTTPGLKMTVTD